MDRRYERVLEQVIGELRDELGDELLGILLAGSVAYGTPMTTSDLDVFALIRPPWRQRRSRLVGDVEVEVFLNAVDRIRAELAEGGSTVDCFARGRVILDPHGVVAELAREARRAAGRPRPEPSHDEVFNLRYRPTDSLKDTRDLLDAGDEAGATLLLYETLRWALDAHYALARRRPPKPKYLLADLDTHAPKLGAAVRTILGPGSTRERYERLAALVERILAPAGGLLVEGETEPETIHPGE